MPVAKHSGGGTPRLRDIPRTPRTWGPSFGLLIGSTTYALAIAAPISLPALAVSVAFAIVAILVSLADLDRLLSEVNNAS